MRSFTFGQRFHFERKFVGGSWFGLYVTRSPAPKAAWVPYSLDGSNGQQVNQHVGRCGANFVGAVMITGSGGTQYDGATITNTKIAHSKSDGIVSDANNSGGFCKTDYAQPALNVTFDDIAGQQLRNGACP